MNVKCSNVRMHCLLWAPWVCLLFFNFRRYQFNLTMSIYTISLCLLFTQLNFHCIQKATNICLFFISFFSSCIYFHSASSEIKKNSCLSLVFFSPFFNHLKFEMIAFIPLCLTLSKVKTKICFSLLAGR